MLGAIFLPVNRAVVTKLRPATTKTVFRTFAIAVVLLAACSSPPGPPAPALGSLATAESLYADLRALRDRIDVGTEAGSGGHDQPPPSQALVPDYNGLRERVASRLAAVDSGALSGNDARALGLMRRSLARDLRLITGPAGAASSPHRPPDCDYDAPAVAARTNGLDSLRQRLYACYGWAQSHVIVDGDTLDRLSVLGALGRTDSPDARRRLFLSLVPVWRSVNGDNSPASPYRQLIAREVKERGKAAPPAAEQARASGVPPDSLERWLRRVLETWREVTPDSLIEPWDWFYQAGLTSRRLSPLIPRERLTSLNRQVYQSLGADIGTLGVQYDLEPREGKTPVAYSTFGRPAAIHQRRVAWGRAVGIRYLSHRRAGQPQ